MSPGQTLGLLLALAGTSSGWLYHLSGGKSSKPVTFTESGESVERIEERLIAVQKENATLRSLLQGGGDVPVSVALQSHIENTTKLSFEETPKVSKASIGELEELALEKLENQYRPGMLSGRSDLWAALGLITPGTDVAQQLAIAMIERDRYIATKNEVLVSESVEPDSYTLAKALAEHLLLKNHSLPKIQSDAQLWSELAKLESASESVAVTFTPKSQPASDHFEIDLTPPFIRLLATRPAFAQQIEQNANLGPLAVASLFEQTGEAFDPKSYKSDQLTINPDSTVTWQLHFKSKASASSTEEAFKTAFQQSWEQTELKPKHSTQIQNSTLTIEISPP